MSINVEELRAMVEGGMSVTAIAQELNVSTGYISKLIAQLKLGKAMRRSALSRLSDEEREEAVKMYLDGAPVQAILHEFNLNYNAFYKLLSEENVEMRQRSESAKADRKLRMDHAVALYEEGLPLWQIERDTGLRQPQIHRELHLRGVPLRRQRRAEAAAAAVERYDEDLAPEDE